MRFVGKVKGPKRPPLRTMKEMAELLGITHGVLHSAFMAHESRPKPALNAQGDYTGEGSDKRYYVPSEVRAWWDALPENNLKGK